MPDTIAGLFKTRSEANEALRKLKESGFGPDQISVSTPRTRRHGHYGTKVGAGIAIGAVVGALVGALAAGMLPGVHPLIPGNMWATFALVAITGAATGGIAGLLISMAAAGDRALFYEQEVEAGRILISVAGPRLEVAEALMREAGAMEAAPVEAPIEKGRPRPESG